MYRNLKVTTLGLWFAVHYPDETPRRGRRLLQRLLPLFLLSGIAGVALSVGWALAYVSTAVGLTSLSIYVGISGFFMLLAFAEGWWHSSGPARQRFAWLLGSFALFYVASFPTYLSDLFDLDFDGWVSVFSVLGTLTMYLGLA